MMGADMPAESAGQERSVMAGPVWGAPATVKSVETGAAICGAAIARTLLPIVWQASARCSHEL